MTTFLRAGVLSTASAYACLASAQSLDPATTYAVGSSPKTALIADFNGDGIGDIACTNTASNTITLRLSTGIGTYAAPADIPIADGPTGIAAADFNHDGRMDIAVARSGVGAIAILLNTGGGVFAAPVSYTAGPGPQQLITGDLDSDGDFDVAVADRDENHARVLKNFGDGNLFFLNGLYAVGATPEWIAVGNIDNVNAPDLVLANRITNNVSVLLSNGTGLYSGPVNVTVGASARGVAIGDFNGDSAGDIAVFVNSAPPKILILWNSANSFAQANSFPLAIAPETPNSIAAADVDGDHRADLVVASESAGVGRLSVYRGTGVQASPFLPPLSVVVGSGPTGVALGDLDQDRDLDFAVANAGDGTMSTVINHLREITGDANCDGNVNNFDIDPFVMALTAPAAYLAAYPTCSLRCVDADNSGALNNFDIDPFVALILH